MPVLSEKPLKKAIANISVLFGLLGLLCNCGGSIRTLYPDFDRQRKRISNATLIADVVIIEDLGGDFNKVDVVENKQIGEAFLHSFADQLYQKGYPVSRTVLTSIGLLMNPSRIYRVVRTTEDRRLDNDSLLLESPPFFIDETFGNDSSMAQALGSIYNSLVNYRKNEGDANKIIPEATRLANEVGDGALAVALLGGYDVPVTRQIDEGRITPNVSQSKVAVHPTSQLSIMFYILDTKSGEVIWADQKYEKGGVIYNDKILKAIEDFINNLP